MLLTIDIGNTNMVFGIYKDEEMLGSFRLSTNSTATSDEVGIMAVSYFERFGYRAEDLKACIIGSVVPQVMYSVTSAIIKYFGVEPLVVGTDVDTGLKSTSAAMKPADWERIEPSTALQRWRNTEVPL